MRQMLSTLRSKRMKPFSPQAVPHEFLTFQQFCVSSWQTPTRVTPWSRSPLQVFMIPPVQDCQQELPAETATATGRPLTIAARAEQLERAPPWQFEILKLPPVVLHDEAATWVQGQLVSSVKPQLMTQLQTQESHPPLQPALPCGLEQSTICCSLKSMLEYCALFLSKKALQMVASVLKEQQLPQEPWFLMAETQPSVVQSIFRVELGVVEGVLFEEESGMIVGMSVLELELEGVEGGVGVGAEGGVGEGVGLGMQSVLQLQLQLDLTKALLRWQGLYPKVLSMTSSANFLCFLISFLISKSNLGTFLGAFKVRYNLENSSTVSPMKGVAPMVKVN